MVVKINIMNMELIKSWNSIMFLGWGKWKEDFNRIIIVGSLLIMFKFGE